ncbi:type II toxin-antitoxin system VapC family toxin [Chelativorans sp.]|uniref:type II toxin-antitoxin system VapC family toxin n=1 Tax=Chelativorans sp. TaxID=2203393 RepID=UPI002812732B|nr:type II toxin-antitoxin system VapC family toxin [Chelativorans sp.]
MIVIDTHVLLWWFGGETQKLSAKARKVLEAERNGGSIFVSSISAWEIATLAAHGRVTFATDVSTWLRTACLLEALTFVPIDNEIAVLSTQLGPDFHKDPADRFIVATSQKLAAPLVTADSKIRSYPSLRTIW